MLITTAHLLALKELASGEAAGHAVRTLTEDDSQEYIYRGLELQGLVLLEPPRAYRLTYAGREALGLFEAKREAALVPPLEQLENDWRFLGSDILAALQAAQRKRGRVGPLTAEALSARGLTESVHDTLEKRSFVRLNQYGEAWGDFARRYRPRLEIDSDLANSIHYMHPGYTGRPDLHIPAEHIALLEVMDLLSWSVPERTIYALTALGQAVYEALRKGGYAPLDAVLDEPTLEVLALLVDRGSEALTSEQMLDLQTLGYVELDGSVSADGQAAMRAYALLQRESPEQVRAFAITEPEGELLAAMQQLAEPANGSQLHPDKKTLHRVLVDRMVKRYQDFVGRYGRTVKERSAKKRQAVAMLEHLKEHDEWFGTFWDLEELLVSLEAFDLLRAEGEGPRTVYRLTPNGYKVVAEQAGMPRDITATAVKVLTTAATRFQAPADSWVEQAREEGLIGTGGVTRSGRFYAELAEHCVRAPALTREEAEVLVNLPETVRDHSSLDEEKQDWAFEKLEARGLILQQVEQGNVTSVTINSDDSVTGTFKTPVRQPPTAQPTGAANGSVAATHFTTLIPATGDPNLLPLLEKKGVEINAQIVQPPWWETALGLLLNSLPLLLLLYFGVMSLRGMRQVQNMQGGGLFGIGRSRAKLYKEERPQTTFGDVAGVDEAKMELREVIDFLRDPQRYIKIGAHIPRGILLVGPPGTGKTLLARAVAGEAGVPFFSASATDFVELFVGVGASRVRDLFEQARKNAPCIIFIDEIDAIGRTRSGAGAIASNDEREHTLEQLLVEMDGFEPHDAIVVLAATNRPDVLDPALQRPGRFDRQVVVDRPERRGREAILRIHTRHVPLAPDVNLEELARQTAGFSGADLANLVNEAALAAARHGKTQVDHHDFQEALDKLLLGGKREALMDERERRIVANHEGGHALVAAVLPDVDPLYKVTIVPRGRSLGVTQFLPEDDRRNYSRSYLLQRLAVALGGRTGEEVALGEITSGAENDLKEATKLARRMVTEWGMGEQTGVVAYDLDGDNPFLGQQTVGEPGRVYSEVTAERVDAEVERLLEQAHQQARTVLSEHRAELERLAQALLQEEVLERDQILAIIGGAQTAQQTPQRGGGEGAEGKPSVGVEH